MFKSNQASQFPGNQNMTTTKQSINAESGTDAKPGFYPKVFIKSHIQRDFIEQYNKDIYPRLLWDALIKNFDRFIDDADKLSDYYVSLNSSKKVFSLVSNFFVWLFTARYYLEWYSIEFETRIRAKHKTVSNLLNLVKEGKSNALYDLVACDPRWLYEPWVKKIVHSKCIADDVDFFYLLGKAISDQKRKVFRGRARGANKDIVNYLNKEYGKEGVFFKVRKQLRNFTYRELLDEMIDKGIVDPDKKDISPRGLEKIIKRHLLFETPLRHK